MALTLEQARQNALNRRKSITPQTAQQNITAEENKPENTGGLLGGVGYTLGRVGLGALRGLEGIWDFAAGGIADLFGADEWAYEQATESPFDDLTTELDAWYNPSEFMQFVGDVGAGVGQMLPSVAVAAIPGAGPALSTAMFTTSAAGMGVSDAAKTTGELGAKEWLYGGASGAVEGAIEKLSGGIGGTKLGTVLGKQVAKSTAGKVAATFVGEGLEEVASDLIDPALRRVTGVDPEATVDVEQLPNTFLVGGTAGALLGGGSRVVNAARSGGFNNLNAREDLATIREAQSKGNTLQNEGKLSAKWESTLSSKQTEAEQRLSSRLQKMDAETRGKFISDNNLGSVFDADGNIRTAAEGYTAPKYNADAVSFSAREDLNRGTLQYAPTQKAVREDIKSAISDVTKISDGQGKYVVVDTLGTTNAGQKINGFYDRSTGVTYIANDGDTNGTKSFVVSHEYVHTLEGTNAYNKYANEIIKQIESDPALKEKYNIDAYVETYRKAQPDYESETIAYIAQTEMVADFTANEILSNEDAVRRLANRNKSLVTRVYEWVKDKIKTLTSKGGSRENIAYLRKAERMLAKVLDMPTGGVDIQKEDQEIKEQNAKKNAEINGKTIVTEIRYSLMNEKPFAENVDEIIHMSDDDARTNAKEGNFVSIMKHTPYVILNNVNGAEDLEVIIRFDALYLASRSDGVLQGHYHALGEKITKQLPKLISNPDSIVRMDNGRLNIFAEMTTDKGKNGIISIELNTVKDINSKYSKYNLVVSAFSAKDNYVRNTLQKHAERVEYIKKDLSQVNPQLYEWLAIINERSNGSFTTTNSIRDNTKKVNNNVENSGERFSISVDSEGNTLSEQQQEYFKDSKVRDESGNLLPVYHGSPNEFFVFDRNRMGKGNDQFGAGFYFATDEDASRHYGDKVIKSYLNIQKPIVINRTEDGGDLYDVHLTQKQAYEILKRHPKIYDAEESPLGDLFDEYWEVGPKDYMIRQAAKNLDSIGLMDSDYTAFRNYPNELHEAIREVLGYDGVEVRFAGSNEKFYVAWFENQIKQTSNKNPTGSTDIRYSLSMVNPVKPTTGDWKPTLNTEEAKKRFPNLWDVSAEESQKRNPTQINGTVKSYRKIYDKLKEENFNGTILDASSGLGYGTKAGIEEYGFNVEDIEPYPDQSYNPKYRDYSKLNKKYDVIISNAVLNVLPQDQRDALVIKMGELLKDGGRIFINVRGDDVNNLSSNSRNVKIDNMEWYVADTGSYQKGFTRKELTAYLQDALGDNFTISPASFYGKTAVVVTKNPKSDIRYSISQNQNTRDENYINNKLKTYTYADVESIVDNLTINKYGDDVVLRGKKNVGKQIYTLLNETPIRNRRAKVEQIARQIVYQNLAAQSLYNAEEIENARKDGIEISETWIDKKLSSQLSETENEALVKEIRGELLDSFETAGKLNDTGKMYLRYKDVGDRLSKLLVKDSILKTARRMKKRNYPKAFEAFDGIRKILAKLEMRSDINEESGRDIIKAFGEFYTASNEALQGYYSEEVRQAIDDFISYNGEGNLDLYELEQIDTILNAADHLLKEYDKAFLNGRTVSVTKTSSKAVNTVKENADLYKATVLGAMRLKGYVGSFFRSIVDTRTLAMWLDGGNKGIITELFEDIAKASTKQTITVMDLYDDFDKFIKKNKKFYKSLEQKVTFKFNGKDVEITRGEAISLYLTSLQEDGLYHLAFGGFAVGKDQNNIRRYVGQKPLYGTPEDVEQYESEVMQQAKKEFSALYDTFTETEKEYIRLARDLFNNKAKRIKQEIDIQRIGMTNANVENYFPERVYEVGRPLKQGNTYIQEMNLIANQSIHKDRVKGSKQTLYISPVNMVVMNHIRQIAMYNAYAIPIDTLRRVMNKNVSLTFDGKPNTAQAETLKTVIQETAWADFEKFLDKYMVDVQGGSFSNTTPDKIIRWMRSNYAKFQLGLNIKTMLSQLTSLPMAGSRIGWKNLLKGTFAKPNFEEMLKYSEWARARNYEGAAYKSQSLVDNVDKVGQLAMKPIGMVDLFTMNRIYNAAKYYIASRDGVSLDSVECKTKAAAMLEEIGRETQNNSEAAEKSSLMRSGNELIKSIVMFSSDAMKQFSSLIQSLNKIKFIKQKIKLGKGDKAALEKQLSSARKEARGAFASVGVSSAMYVLMGMLVNYGLFAKEPEDDESYIEIFLKNFGGSVTGMIPVVRDLYSFFVEGYELDNFAYETVNGLSEAVKNIGTLMERAGSGERVTDQEWMLAMRKFIYAAGQITGLPTRNLYNQIYGLIKRVSPSAAYDINSMFYGASTKDLDKAIQKGDTALSTTIAEQLLSDKGIDASKEVASVFSDLYSKGYSMPKGIPESITYNEEEISLNAKQQGIVIDAYSEAANKAEGLINSADWASLSDDAKANALKLLFNYYYYYGINKATGAHADNRTLLLGSAIDITKIASAYGKIAELTADTDKKGNVISGTKKAKVQRLVNSLRLSAAQKYILMGFLGYKNSNGESSVTSYIRNIGISQDMQTALFEMSGYEVS